MAPGERKTGVGDRKPHFEESFLVGGLNRQHLVGVARAVDVGVRDFAWQPVAAHHLVRIAEKMLRIGLEVDPSVGGQYAGVISEEKRRGEAFLRPAALELRVGEGDPYLVDLALGEQAVDKLDARAQEPHVGHPAVGGGFGAPPHACALDVDADEIARRVALGQRYGIFALAAAQFEYDRVVVMEKVAAPMPFERVVATEYLVEFGLYETVESQVLAELAELVLAHCCLLFAFYDIDADGLDALHRAAGGDGYAVVARAGEADAAAIGEVGLARQSGRSVRGRECEPESLFVPERVGCDDCYAYRQRVFIHAVVVAQEQIHVTQRRRIGVGEDDGGGGVPARGIHIGHRGSVG